MTFHEPPANHHHLPNGGIKMLHNGRYTRILFVLPFIVFLSIFYFLGNITSTSYMEIIGRAGNYKFFKSSPYFDYVNGTAPTMERKGYLVWSPSCRIPDVDPMHDSIKQFVKKRKNLKCSHQPLLTSITRNNSIHILNLHKSNFQKYSKNRQVSCCYSIVSRAKLKDLQKRSTKEVDDAYVIGECKSFNESIVLCEDEEFVKVQCLAKKGSAVKEVYTNVHAMARKLPRLNKKFQANESSLEEKLSVMIIGIDSISRLNLIRSMPKTVKYLKKNGWLEFKGYNKIDDNTFPNVMAILTGYSLSHVRDSCWKSRETIIDNCPLIWQNFSNQGYVTAYSEDETLIGTFNFRKPGFLQQPTDYYTRPYMLVAEKFLSKNQHGLHSCLGPTTGADHILNYAIDFAKTVRKVPSFSLFWVNSFSHNDLNGPSSMDDRIATFLHELSETGALNTTLVIFLSDHGMRFGSIRETYVGWLEERLPYIYFWVPDFYKNIYPQKYNNLIVNANRLTSPFDLHLTLQDILGHSSNGSVSCPKCQSLFEEVPWNRSCQDVGVTEHWCTCSKFKSVSTNNKVILDMVQHILKELNSLLDNGTKYLNNGTQCAKLNLLKVLSARSKVFAQTVGYEEYVILFETMPNEALFEATVRHKTKFKLIDTVSRINSYGTQSKCMNDAFLQKYCYCIK